MVLKNKSKSIVVIQVNGQDVQLKPNETIKVGIEDEIKTSFMHLLEKVEEETKKVVEEIKEETKKIEEKVEEETKKVLKKQKNKNEEKNN